MVPRSGGQNVNVYRSFPAGQEAIEAIWLQDGSPLYVDTLRDFFQEARVASREFPLADSQHHRFPAKLGQVLDVLEHSLHSWTSRRREVVSDD